MHVAMLQRVNQEHLERWSRFDQNRNAPGAWNVLTIWHAHIDVAFAGLDAPVRGWSAEFHGRFRVRIEADS